MLLRPWGLILLYPALSTAITSTAYFGIGPAIFRKTAGRLPLASRLLLAPVLVGQYLSLRYYSRQCRPYDQLTPTVWIGRVLSRKECDQAIAAGVRTVLDLTGEFSTSWPLDQVTYINHPIMDLTAPTAADLLHLAQTIDHHQQQGIVYIHCKIGYSRTAAVAGLAPPRRPLRHPRPNHRPPPPIPPHHHHPPRSPNRPPHLATAIPDPA